ADAEKHDRVLVAAAFKMRLAVRDASNVASGGADFFQFAVWSIEWKFPLQHEGNVGDLVLMDFHLRVRVELEDGIDDAVLAVDIVNIKRGVCEPIELAPCQIAIVELVVWHVRSLRIGAAGT